MGVVWKTPVWYLQEHLIFSKFKVQMHDQFFSMKKSLLDLHVFTCIFNLMSGEKYSEEEGEESE